MSSILGRAAVDVQVEEGDYPEEQLLPSGPHQAMAIDISEGRNEDRGEDWVKVVFEITSGPYQGNRVADWWGYGANEVKQQISEKKFKTLMTLCGVNDVLTSYDQLLMTPITINNKPYRGKSDGVMRNSINFYKRAGTPAAATTAAPAPVMQQAPVVQAPVVQAPVVQAPVVQAPVMQSAPPPVVQQAPAPVMQAPPVVQQPVQMQPQQQYAAPPVAGAVGDPPF